MEELMVEPELNTCTGIDMKEVDVDGAKLFVVYVRSVDGDATWCQYREREQAEAVKLVLSQILGPDRKETTA